MALLWYGLSSNTRGSYVSGFNSWAEYCPGNRIPKWPATSFHLGEWVASCIIPRHGAKPVVAATMSAYVSAVRSMHVDLGLN
jgi:hypothetical protein